VNIQTGQQMKQKAAVFLMCNHLQNDQWCVGWQLDVKFYSLTDARIINT